MKILAILFLLVSNFSVADELLDTDKEVIDSYLSDRATFLSVSEYKKARRFIYGNISKNSSNDLAVRYTLESFNGGNNYYYFLAVFKRVDSKLIFQSDKVIGGKFNRSLEFDTFKNGLITFNTKFDLPTDPSCCPSGIGRATFYIDSRKNINELNVSPIKAP